MPSRRVIAVVSASALVATSILAACSGFSSEETGPSGDAGASGMDGEAFEAGSGNDATPDDEAGGSGDSSIDGSSCVVDAGASATLGPYAFDDNVLPLAGWTIEPNVQKTHRRIQILSEPDASSQFSLKVTASSGSGYFSNSIFMTRVLDTSAAHVSLKAKMNVYKVCINDVACPEKVAIARAISVQGHRFYWTLTSDGNFGLQVDGAAPVYSKLALLNRDTWETTELTISSGGAMTVSVGNAKSSLSSGLACDDRIASLAIGVDSAEFQTGIGWVYYLDDLQVETSH